MVGGGTAGGRTVGGGTAGGRTVGAGGRVEPWGGGTAGGGTVGGGTAGGRTAANILQSVLLCHGMLISGLLMFLQYAL